MNINNRNKIIKWGSIGLQIVLFTLVIFSGFCSGQSATDIDGNTYQTITIGNQTWFQENLRTTHFNNGVAIPTDTNAVNNVSTSVYQWAYNDDTSYVANYGRLYSWFAVDDSNQLCPAGWHVPSTEEWDELIAFLGGDTIAGAKVKSAGTSFWVATDSTVTNSSLFNALPGGFRGNPKGYSNEGQLAGFWSSTSFGTGGFPRAHKYSFSAYHNRLVGGASVGNVGMSVRCIKNKTSNIGVMNRDNTFQVFPNPATSKVIVSRKVAGAGMMIHIYNIQGVLVIEQDFNGLEQTINLDKLSAGVYIIRVMNDSQKYNTKLIKH